jgi:GT2 family glycosyltransferase
VPATTPSLSVVMATHDREAMLADALAALDAQEGCELEIVVVDDCSTDGTPDRLRREAARRHGFVALRTARNAGPAVARNRGWRAASGEWIAFTDDDCEVDPGWARALLEVAKATGCDIVQGRTVPNPAHRRDSPWAKAVHVTAFSHRYQTCNLLVRRRALEALGGFDESYPFAGEDADLGWRAVKAGYRTAFAPEARVRHAIRSQTCREYLRSRAVWAQLAHFYKVHPEARFLLWGGLFHHRTHLTSAVLVAGLGVVGHLGSWALVPALYLAHAVNNARRAAPTDRSFADRLRFAVVAPVAELWEAASFVRSSVRYRTVVL